MVFVKKIVSLGPACNSYDMIKAMAELGVDGFRINFAHGNPEEWKKYVSFIRRAEVELGKPIAIIGDIQGPSIRVGNVPEFMKIKKGDMVKFIYGDEGDTHNRVIPVAVKKFFDVIDVGDMIVMDDGKTRFQIVDRGSNYVEAIALNDSIIKPRKTLIIQGKELDMPILNEKDIVNLRFAIENAFDYIGLSYVRNAEDVENVRKLLNKYERSAVGLIAKIETKSAVKNLNDIIDVSDVILVARGDLGMNFSLEEIHYLQKHIVDKCLEKRSPVIVATQLLESMIENPVPTRAEIVDVSIAAEMGVDALMLTGETSIGKYPLEAVKWLKKIIDNVEIHLHKSMDKLTAKARDKLDNLRIKFAKGVLELAEDTEAKLLVFSIHGYTARQIASLRPRVSVYVASPDIQVLRKLAILWGLNLVHVEAKTYEEGLKKTLEKAIKANFVNYGDLVVLTYGLKEPRQYIEILRVEV